MIIQRLLHACSSSAELARFISDNYIEIVDKLNRLSFGAIHGERESVSQISLHYNIIGELDFSDKKNFLFIESLLKLAVRINDFFLFNLLLKFYNSNKLHHESDSSLVDAATLILSTGHSLEYYIDAFKKSLDILKTNDTDNESTTHAKTNYYFRISFICSFYALISRIFEFNPDAVKEFKQNLNLIIEEAGSSHFLNCDLLQQILSYKIEYGKNLTDTINRDIDVFFENNLSFSDFELARHLIENDTKYSGDISATPFISLTSIRQISNSLHSSNDNDYYSLSSGVAVLISQNQLHQYLFSYGKMHRLKLEEGLNSFPNDIFISVEAVYDWGCGQGLGAVATLDKIHSLNSIENLKSVYLIEPSNCAIKRAALHVSTYTQNYITINKDFDSLLESDFVNTYENSIHILSNIVDVELYSLSHFLNIITKLIKGNHYFVIVSPSITSIRTMRLDTFCEEILKKYSGEIIRSLSKKKGEWNNNNYTIELRALSIEQKV